MTLRVDFDTDRWVYVPRDFPWNGYETADEWVATVSRLASEAFEYGEDATDQLEHFLRQLLAYPRMTPDIHRFALLGAPDGSLEMVQVLETPTDGDTDMDRLLGLPDPAMTRDPEITSVTGGLGEGRRAVRHTRADDLGGDIVVSVNWAWRTGGSDVVVMYGTSNLVLLDTVLPVLDQFAASISLADAA
ncbi:hypothetical protein [Isoptericola sp. BMS4]|uniref:hypothetical protein n=1 Tax=Isoptericola sp. BMS4 TaxID=2527875 RepID=UPI0014204126|nr:hypothetical protein [Isoptericola sp. BMS4]